MVFRVSSGAEQAIRLAAGKQGSAVPECAIVVVAVARTPYAEPHQLGVDARDRDPVGFERHLGLVDASAFLGWSIDSIVEISPSARVAGRRQH